MELGGQTGADLLLEDVDFVLGLLVDVEAEHPGVGGDLQPSVLGGAGDLHKLWLGVEVELLAQDRRGLADPVVISHGEVDGDEVVVHGAAVAVVPGDSAQELSAVGEFGCDNEKKTEKMAVSWSKLRRKWVFSDAKQCIPGIPKVVPRRWCRGGAVHDHKQLSHMREDLTFLELKSDS